MIQVEACRLSAPVTSLIYQKEVTFEEVNLENDLKKFCDNLDIKV